MLRSIERFDGTAWATVTEVALEEPKVFHHHHCHWHHHQLHHYCQHQHLSVWCLKKSEWLVFRSGGPEAP